MTSAGPIFARFGRAGRRCRRWWNEFASNARGRTTSPSPSRTGTPLPRKLPFARGESDDELDQLHYRMGRDFEFGTVYTMVAGLLNVLVIYDAWAGPAFVRKKEDDAPPADGDKDKDKSPKPEPA